MQVTTHPMYYIPQGGKMQQFDGESARISCPEGKSFDVYLPENSASTGYSWKAFLLDDGIKQTKSEIAALPGLGPNVRAMPMHHFTFQVEAGASKLDQTGVDFRLTRPGIVVQDIDVKRLIVTAQQ